ncbi:hypothetical protein Pelo_13985 [Pelomyxa schiedti]|nr:hypothetical protein Pelo_13985 [Pelomyxa schiedti]
MKEQVLANLQLTLVRYDTTERVGPCAIGVAIHAVRAGQLNLIFNMVTVDSLSTFSAYIKKMKLTVNNAQPASTTASTPKYIATAEDKLALDELSVEDIISFRSLATIQLKPKPHPRTHRSPTTTSGSSTTWMGILADEGHVASSSSPHYIVNSTEWKNLTEKETTQPTPQLSSVPPVRLQPQLRTQYLQLTFALVSSLLSVYQTWMNDYENTTCILLLPVPPCRPATCHPTNSTQLHQIYMSHKLSIYTFDKAVPFEATGASSVVSITGDTVYDVIKCNILVMVYVDFPVS